MDTPLEPTASMPMIPVWLVCYVDGLMQEPVRAICSSVPRVGELVMPQAGSGLLMVHAVIHEAGTLTPGNAAIVPRIILREMTEEERAHFFSVSKPYA